MPAFGDPLVLGRAVAVSQQGTDELQLALIAMEYGRFFDLLSRGYHESARIVASVRGLTANIRHTSAGARL